MDVEAIGKKLIGSDNVDRRYIKEASSSVAEQVCGNKIKIIDLIKNLDSVLTNGNHEIRLRGVEILSQVITSVPKSLFSEKEVVVLNDFLCLRLIDHKSMEQPALQSISYFFDSPSKPANFNKDLIEFFKTKTNVQRLAPKSRSYVIEIMKKVFIERRQKCSTIDSNLVYSFLHMIEGENHPVNLMLCFGTVSYILKNFQGLDPYIDDFFEWLSSYYPIDYSPNDKDETDNINITKSDLVNALYDCFYANELNSENLQTLLLEKLDSNATFTKLESLNCLIKCYQVFSFRSIKDYASSLWTVVRVTCLKKRNLIDSMILDTSLKALSALTAKLAEDDETYFTFISDMYEELSIAFRKPEMDLFEPASILLTHAAQPKLVGFNYILNKILPLSLNALTNSEMRPLAGLAYIFKQLLLTHPRSAPNLDLDLLDKLVVHILGLITANEDALVLLNSIVRCKIGLKPSTLDEIIARLIPDVEKSSLDLGECLALISIMYERSDIIFDEIKGDCSMDTLIRQVGFYRLARHVNASNLDEKAVASNSVPVNIINKFLIYLRQLILLLDECKQGVLNSAVQDDLDEFLAQLRELATEIPRVEVVESIAKIHGIILNKLEKTDQILMRIFKSRLCQNLVPNSKDERELSKTVHLPLLKWILKSLVVSNNPKSVPIINLLLNFITSENTDESLALSGVQIFSFVHKTTGLFDRSNHYEVFAIFRQKFYSQTSKEVKIRYEKQKVEPKRQMLLCSLAIQTPHLPPSVYTKDFEWLLRELLKTLKTLRDQDMQDGDLQDLICLIYGCLDNLVRNDSSGSLHGLIGSFLDISLLYGKEGASPTIRKTVLACLAAVAISLDHSELIVFRTSTMQRLKACLADKKRIVRQAAAEARLKWTLVGQPIGS